MEQVKCNFLFRNRFCFESMKLFWHLNWIPILHSFLFFHHPIFITKMNYFIKSEYHSTWYSNCLYLKSRSKYIFISRKISTSINDVFIVLCFRKGWNQINEILKCQILQALKILDFLSTNRLVDDWWIYIYSIITFEWYIFRRKLLWL